MPTERDERLLNDLLDGRLTDAEAQAARDRMDADPALRETFEELERVGVMVRDFDPAVTLEPPADFGARVRERISAEDASATHGSDDTIPAPRAGRLLQMMAYGYAAAAVLVLAVTALWMLDQDSEQPIPDTIASNDGASDDLDSGDGSPGYGTPGGGAAPDMPEGLAADKISEQREADRAQNGRMKAPDGEADAPALGAKKAQDEGARKTAGSLESAVPSGPAQPGVFRTPGGSVPPGLREPSDAPAPPPPSGGALDDSRRRGGSRPPAAPISAPPMADLGSGGRDAKRESNAPVEAAVYMLEVDDVDAAKAEIQLVLASLEGLVAEPDEHEDRLRQVLDQLSDDDVRFYRVSPDDPSLARLAELPVTAEAGAAGKPASDPAVDGVNDDEDVAADADDAADPESTPAMRKTIPPDLQWVGTIDHELSERAALALASLVGERTWAARSSAAPPEAPAAATTPAPTTPATELADLPPPGASAAPARPSDPTTPGSGADPNRTEELDPPIGGGSGAEKQRDPARVSVRIVLVKRKVLVKREVLGERK